MLGNYLRLMFCIIFHWRYHEVVWLDGGPPFMLCTKCDREFLRAVKNAGGEE